MGYSELGTRNPQLISIFPFMNIILIGYRGSGKSEVGRRLSTRLGMKFVDTDDFIEKHQGTPISEIVQTYGWDHFRTLEKEVISTISDCDQQVVAAGGGAVLDPDNVAVMKTRGLIIWLKADPDTLLKRMQKDPQTIDRRPSLTGRGSFEEIEEVLTFRNAFYEEASAAQLDTSKMDIETVVESILTIISLSPCACLQVGGGEGGGEGGPA
jgi:shikimate kinase